MSSKVNHHELIKEFLNNQSRHHKESMMALAKRAVACSGWRWLPGMKAVHPQNGSWFRLEEPRTRLIGDSAEALPDFTDEATSSVLLQVVRKVRGPFVYAEPKGNGWRVLRPTSDASDTGERFKVISCTYILGSTEVEALVKALEAAP